MADPEAVRRDLLYLRKGTGYTASRLQRCTALRATLGTPNDPESVLRERLLSAISSLRDEDAALLLPVYALGDDERPPTLQERRDRVGALLGIRREAVADRDTAAVERLLVQLITGWYPKSPLPLPTPESHGGAVLVSIGVTTVVANRRHASSHYAVRLFAIFDDAEYFGWTTQPDVVLEPAPGWTVTAHRAPGGLLHRFRLPRSMRRGQTYDLRFTLQGDPADPAYLMEESLAFHEPTRQATFRAVFLGELPARVWRFTGLTAHERPGTPHDGDLVTPDGNGTATADFIDLYGGLYSGLAWDW